MGEVSAPADAIYFWQGEIDRYEEGSVHFEKSVPETTLLEANFLQKGVAENLSRTDSSFSPTQSYVKAWMHASMDATLTNKLRPSRFQKRNPFEKPTFSEGKSTDSR